MLAWLAPRFSTLALGRLVQGIGLGWYRPACWPGSWWADVPSGPAARWRCTSRALTLGGAIGPAVRGPLAEQFGWRSALLFCVVAGLAAVGPGPATRDGASRSSPAALPEPARPPRLDGARGDRAGAVAPPRDLPVPGQRLATGAAALRLGGRPAWIVVGRATAWDAGRDVAGDARAGGWATNRYGLRPVLAGALLVTSRAVAAMPLVPTPGASGRPRSCSAAGWP